MPLYTNNPYDYDVTSIKQFGNNIVKVTNLNICRKPGYESEKKQVKKGSVNDSKLDNNLSRAKAKVKELVLCNQWDYWCTFTISPDKYDRYNLKAYVKDLSEFIHNYNRKCNDSDKVKYIFIPEMHSDGAWHIHGFIKGILKSDLYVNKFNYLTWKQYESKFGYISMSPINDIEKCSSYALKYMMKVGSGKVTELGAHIYYASKGLNKAKELYKGKATLLCEWDWEHPDGYCRVKSFDLRKVSLQNIPIEVHE